MAAIHRLLIANRGEIACRIARTAQRLGMTVIAVYSDADRDAMHVRSADEAYYLGASPAAESYLDQERLLETAKRVRADAIHPGYGFLSENAAFAQRCADAGILFVGPPAAAIRAMGSKSASKAAMAAVGVPVAPGYHGNDQSLDGLTREALRIGFPLIIKASAGGGGKGMQVVNNAAEVAPAVESAQRLARTAFGDDHLLMERYFVKARHVEVQIFADAHGNIVSLFDRDCSVQRRHQKIIEEAPAPGLRDEVRATMAQAAKAAAQAVDYVGAGTVEFLVDVDQNFYFMEMNTRLQVEHPVTEFITGIDLVEWQLNVAQGARLPLGQEDITQRGVAIEARLYAEDPSQGYLPSIGHISHLRWPDTSAAVRLDVGTQAGDDVSSFYDPMLGKVIVWSESRRQACDVLRRALDEVEIAGVATNRALLSSILADESFRQGAVATDFLGVRREHLVFTEPAPSDRDLTLAALWCATRHTAANDLWSDSRGWRLAATAVSHWRFGTVDGTGTVDVEARAADDYAVRVGAVRTTVRVLARGEQAMDVEVGGALLRVRVIEIASTLHLFHGGVHVELRRSDTADSLNTSTAIEEGSLLTPLPGTVVAVHVAPGERVNRGAPLVTVEAMKMEHTLTAPSDGIVERIAYGLNDRVTAGAVLIELKPA